MAERTVQKLQTEIDRMEVLQIVLICFVIFFKIMYHDSQCSKSLSCQTALLAEKTKKTRMEEDMEHLVQSIGDI